MIDYKLFPKFFLYVKVWTTTLIFYYTQAPLAKHNEELKVDRAQINYIISSISCDGNWEI